MHRALQLACILMVLTIPSLASAQQKKSFLKIPRLKSFKQKSGSQLSLPRIGGKKSDRALGKRITKGPKKVLTKTKDVITPWKSNARKSTRLRSSRESRLALRSNKNRWKPLSRWRGSGANRDRPTTPQEFIARRQPEF